MNVPSAVNGVLAHVALFTLFGDLAPNLAPADVIYAWPTCPEANEGVDPCLPDAAKLALLGGNRGDDDGARPPLSDPFDRSSP